MKKQIFIEELDFEMESKYNFILPRCTICQHHDSTDDGRVLHFCNFYGGLTMPETLDVCEQDGTFKEVS